MRRVLITGMSGTGKSTLIAELAARGLKAIDADTDAWCEWRPAADGVGVSGGLDWVWREDRIDELLATDDAELLFVAGCPTNQVAFYGRFDHIVLLSAPEAVMVERLGNRTTNPYGKQPEEVARILELKGSIEPRLRRVADLEVDTSVPLGEVVARVLAHART